MHTHETHNKKIKRKTHTGLDSTRFIKILKRRRKKKTLRFMLLHTQMKTNSWKKWDHKKLPIRLIHQNENKFSFNWNENYKSVGWKFSASKQQGESKCLFFSSDFFFLLLFFRQHWVTFHTICTLAICVIYDALLLRHIFFVFKFCDCTAFNLWPQIYPAKILKFRNIYNKRIRQSHN